MQIKNIRIKDFKNIKEKEIIPEKVNVIVGNNGAGKTSCLDAIRFILTGKAPMTPVRSGTEKATVEAGVLGSVITRTVGKKCSVAVDGKTTTQKSVQDFIEGATGVTNDTLRITTSADVLASMDAGKLSDYLITNNLIPAEIDFETFKVLYPISAEAEKDLSVMLPAMPTKFNMDVIEEAYSQFYSERPQIKRKLEELKKITEMLNSPHRMRAVSAVDAELQQLVAYNSEMQGYEKLMRAYEFALKNRTNVLEQISELDKKIKETTAAKADPEEKKFLQEQVKKLMERSLSERKTVQTLQMNIDMFQKTLTNLDRPVCPISEKLICTTDKSQVKGELTELVEKNKAEMEKAQAQVNHTNAQIESIRAKQADYEKRESAYRVAQNLFNQRNALKSAIPAIPEKPSMPTVIENADVRRAELEAEKVEIAKYNEALKAKSKITEYQKRLATVEELIKALSPKGGVRETIVEVALAPMIEHCNDRAEELKMNFKVGMDVKDGVRITCSPETSSTEMLPLDSVSKGEQVYALLLVLDALNALSGLNILILDDLDKLDKTALDAMLGLLTKPEVNKPYDHIFMAMVNHDDSMEILTKYKTFINQVICV